MTEMTKKDLEEIVAKYSDIKQIYIEGRTEAQEEGETEISIVFKKDSEQVKYCGKICMDLLEKYDTYDVSPGLNVFGHRGKLLSDIYITTLVYDKDKGGFIDGV